MKSLFKYICDGIFITILGNKLELPYFLCSRGIGDTIIFLSRLDEYYKKNNKKVNLIVQQNQTVLLEPYKDYINQVIVLPPNIINTLIHITWEKKKKNIRFILPCNAIKKLKSGSNLFNLVGETLGIQGEEYLRPEFKVSNARLSEIKKTLGINNAQYVIIAPDAVSVTPTPEKIWIDIAKKNREKGYIILENAQSQDKVRFGDTSIFLPLDEMYEIAKGAKHIFSTRSGLSDLLAFSGTAMTVFYPNKEYLELYSFSNMPFSKHVEEIVIN